MNIEYPGPFLLNMIRMKVSDHSLPRGLVRVLPLPEKEQDLYGSSDSPHLEFLGYGVNSQHL